MSWATSSDMLMRFGMNELCAVAPLADCPSCVTGDFDVTRVDVAISDAQSEAESYVATRYPLPLCIPEGGSIPRLLVNAVCDMAMYRLTVGSALETEPINRRYEEAVRLLRDIAKGVADLPFLCTSAESEAQNGKVGVDIHHGTYDDFFSKRFTEVV